MMKIGWLVWDYEGEEHPRFYEDGTEPEYCWRKDRIVYSVVDMTAFHSS